MTAKLIHIWRHPVKSHGREALDQVTLYPGKTMPWDRTWAVAHEASAADGSEWVPCANFSRVAKAPSLMAITARFEEDSGVLHLSHPDLPDLTVNPDNDPDALIKWAAPIMPEGRAASARVLRVPGRGMTDTPFASISIGNLATHRAIEQKVGHSLSLHRWRINLWLDGLEPWQEFDWVGKQVLIGDVVLKIEEPIERCMATTANPETGVRDADTLGALNSWGHQDMGVYGVVQTGGLMSLGDSAGPV